MHMDVNRRSFLSTACIGTAIGLGSIAAHGEKKPIQGFDDTASNTDTEKKWAPVSDRKIRVGIAGFGFCQFGAAFFFQDHPNVKITAVTDLIPERCEGLAKACRCDKTYPSLEEMVKDDNIEAVFVATDAPSHARHAILCLKHGKHVASAVPAVFGSVEDADELFATVKKTGLNYMLFETSAFHDDVYSMRVLYETGSLGNIVYSEGEYYHYMPEPLPSYKDWRVGLPPMWYPTHSTGYYVGIHGGRFTEVCCMGMPSDIQHLTPSGNAFKNPFGTEIALMRTSEGGMARMAVSWDTNGWGAEAGRVRGQNASVNGMSISKTENMPNTKKPPLPPGVDPGGHGGSHGYLMNEFVMSIIENRKPLIDVGWALSMSVSGVIAHQSAQKDGELLKIPQYIL